VSKHIKLWAMNVFNEWRSFRGFDTTKFVIDLLEDESLVKDLGDMLSSFVLYVEDQIGSLHPPTKYNSLPFLKSFYNWVLISSCVFLLSILYMLI
jgi:hypothetical protein